MRSSRTPGSAAIYDPLDSDRGDLARSLTQADLMVEEVRNAPDRPGREFVFIARRAA